MPNFTVVDTLGTLKACLVLLPFMFAPGYVAGWLINLFEFRQRRPILRLILPVPLSIAICPMLSYLLGRFWAPLLWVFYIGVIVAWLVLLANKARKRKLWPVSEGSLSRPVCIALCFAMLWGVGSVAAVVDLQIGDQLYPPVMAYDHSVRVAMTSAIARHIPPGNPLFANAATPLRYHYLWLLFCSMPMQVIQVSARQVVDAGVVWCGVGLMCTIAIGLKFLVGIRTGIEQKTLIAVGLLSVTGLDLLPNLYIAATRQMWLADTEKWNGSQIDSWASSLLWVPHNVAALIACFVGFVLLRHQSGDLRRWKTGAVVVAGMAFASAAGMSVYVTFTFVIAVGLWLLAAIARKDWLEAGMFVSAGGVAVVSALPFLSSLRGPGGGGAFLEFELRPFLPGIFFLQRLGLGIRTQIDLSIANAILLPVNYGMELGFFLLAGIVRLRLVLRGKIEASPNERAAWAVAASSFLVGTFLRSSTLSTNDLGWRCFLPAQLVLLLWAAQIVHDWWLSHSLASSQAVSSRWTQCTLLALLILGLGGTAYQVFMLRMFPVLWDRGMIAGPSWVDKSHFGKRAYALRSAYQLLGLQVTPAAILQANPNTEDLILHMLYSGHDAAAGDGECGRDFGGDAGVCALRVRRLASLFRHPEGADLDAACRDYGIAAVVVDDSDPVWTEPSSWTWNRQAEIANDYVRAFRCGTPQDAIHP